MDKERKALLTQELSKAETTVLSSVRNLDAFVRVRTIYATLEKGEPEVHIGIPTTELISSQAVMIAQLKRELVTTKSMLTKATKMALTKPETIKKKVTGDIKKAVAKYKSKPEKK